MLENLLILNINLGLVHLLRNIRLRVHFPVPMKLLLEWLFRNPWFRLLFLTEHASEFRVVAEIVLDVARIHAGVPLVGVPRVNVGGVGVSCLDPLVFEQVLLLLVVVVRLEHLVLR